MSGSSPYRWLVRCVSVAVLLFVVSTSMRSVAGLKVTVTDKIDETVEIPNDDFRAYEVILEMGHKLTWKVDVVEGGDIDIYFVNDEGYHDYIDPTATHFLYFVAYSEEKTTSSDESFIPSKADTYVLILDNKNLTISGAISEGPVRVQVSMEKSEESFLGWFTGALLLACAILIIVVVVVIVFLIMRGRKRKAAQLLPPPQGELPPPPEMSGGLEEFPPPPER